MRLTSTIKVRIVRYFCLTLYLFGFKNSLNIGYRHSHYYKRVIVITLSIIVRILLSLCNAVVA